MSKLFEPLKLRDITLRNRLAVSPMCQYESIDGLVNSFHYVHYGRFALGGFGLVMVEATAVSPEGRITHGDLGIWSDEHIEGLSSITKFLKDQGAIPGIQIAHAGPKAGMQRPYNGNGPLTEEDHKRGDTPWPIVSASALAVDKEWPMPTSLDIDGINKVKKDFMDSAKRALKAGFDVLEIHCAHGFLLNTFLSPLTNLRVDEYGGNQEGRMRLPLEIAKDIRAIWPEDKPLFVRISAVDGSRSGVTIDDSVIFAKELKKIGVDVIDCSSGGIGNTYDYPNDYGYQVPFAEKIRTESGIQTMAVGLIVHARQAESIIESGQADIVAIGREALREPNFAFLVEQELQESGGKSYNLWPRQYGWWLNARQKKINQIGEWVSELNFSKK